MSLIPINNELSFNEIKETTLRTLSDSSKRIYARSYDAWVDWCFENDIHPLDISYSTVYDFLSDQPVSKSTRQRYLSSLRQLAKMLSILDYDNPKRRSHYEAIRMIKVPTEGAVSKSYFKTALTAEQVQQVLSVWKGDSLNEIRNAALISLLFSTGLRRFEAVNLRWSDVDLEACTLTVVSGKGDKTRSVAILGTDCIPALKRLKEVQGSSVWVFSKLSADGNSTDVDEPLSDQRVYEIVEATAEKSGIEFHPHDARRTFITEMLKNGAALQDVQAQAGHERGETTLGYARSVDAKQRRKRLFVGW